MFQLNEGMLIGLGLILFTVILVGLLARWTIAGASWDDPEEKARVLKAWSRAFWGAVIFTFVLFAIAFAWTGIYPTQNLDQPQSTVDPGGALKLEPSTGKNRPEERAKRLKEGTELQKEGQERLETFREKFFKQEDK